LGVLSGSCDFTTATSGCLDYSYRSFLFYSHSLWHLLPRLLTPSDSRYPSFLLLLEPSSLVPLCPSSLDPRYPKSLRRTRTAQSIHCPHRELATSASTIPSALSTAGLKTQPHFRSFVSLAAPHHNLFAKQGSGTNLSLLRPNTFQKEHRASRPTVRDNLRSCQPAQRPLPHQAGPRQRLHQRPRPLHQPPLLRPPQVHRTASRRGRLP
jgi:hypothetical protein